LYCSIVELFFFRSVEFCQPGCLKIVNGFGRNFVNSLNKTLKTEAKFW